LFATWVSQFVVVGGGTSAPPASFHPLDARETAGVADGHSIGGPGGGEAEARAYFERIDVRPLALVYEREECKM
jgi:hypothetical protein